MSSIYLGQLSGRLNFFRIVDTISVRYGRQIDQP